MAEKANKIQEKVELPEKATASVTGSTVMLEGPKGKAIRDFTYDNVSIKSEGKAIIITSAKDTKSERAATGAIKAHLRNMATGVTEGHSKKMKICSGHFPMSVAIAGNELTVKNFIGEKTPRKLKIPAGVKVEVKGQDLTVEGCDKDAVGNAAGSIEKLTKRSNFDRRIFQDGIIIVTE